MDDKTRKFWSSFLADKFGGDIEACARFMRDSLRAGSVTECRRILRSLNETPAPCSPLDAGPL